MSQSDAEQSYSYEFIEGRTPGNGHYRIRDSKDNAVGFCYHPDNAQRLVDGLNALRAAPPSSEAGTVQPERRTAEQLAEEWAEWIPYPDSTAVEWDRYHLARAYRAALRANGGSIKVPHAAALAAYAELRPDWNSYGAKPISAKTLRLAAEVSIKLGEDWSTTPLADGGVMFNRNGDEETVVVHVAPSPDSQQERSDPRSTTEALRRSKLE